MAVRENRGSLPVDFKQNLMTVAIRQVLRHRRVALERSHIIRVRHVVVFRHDAASSGGVLPIPGGRCRMKGLTIRRRRGVRLCEPETAAGAVGEYLGGRLADTEGRRGTTVARK